MLRIGSIAAAALALVVPAHAQDRSQEVDRILGAFKPTDPGCSVGVSLDGKTVIERAVGLAQLEHGVPNTPATVFDVASVNKQFIATAVLMLAEDGKLSLKDDIRRYLPEMPDYGTPITIDHLLTQTSGLRDWVYLSIIAGHHPFEAPAMYDAADLLALAAHQRGLNNVPGEQFMYSNTNYGLLALIAERASGRSLQDFSNERIFAPLGMTSTRWRDDIRKIIPGRATSYMRVDGAWVQGMPLFDNLFSTTGDLLRWNDALTANKLSAFVTQELQRQGRLKDGRPTEYEPGTAYTRGLAIGTFNGVREIMHGGSSAGYRSYLARYPAQRLSVAVLCNSSESDPPKLAHELASLFLPAAPSNVAAPAPASASPQALWMPGADELAAFVGRYVSDEVGISVRVTVDGGKLKITNEFRPGVRLMLAPVERDTFASPADKARVTFSRDGTGRVISYGISMPRTSNVRFVRIAEGPR